MQHSIRRNVGPRITHPQRNEQHAGRQAQRGHGDSQVLEHGNSPEADDPLQFDVDRDLTCRHHIEFLLNCRLRFDAQLSHVSSFNLSPILLDDHADFQLAVGMPGISAAIAALQLLVKAVHSAFF